MEIFIITLAETCPSIEPLNYDINSQGVQPNKQTHKHTNKQHTKYGVTLVFFFNLNILKSGVGKTVTGLSEG